ncbi:MAG: hypothetical protein FWC23_08305, partial [Chitinispirillia bacterium]|nr:hypothetical protein [Chitinispirillia bacterium]MCL2269170.1 hypothetical protein [Chitinispirillia bacterium]
MAGRKQNKAIAVLEQKMRDNPRSRAFSRLADLYRESGQLDAAITQCTVGLAEHPEYVTGRLVLGRCYKEQHNLPAAVDELSKVCATDTRNLAALKMLAEIFLEQGRKDAAGSLYAILSDMDPDNPVIRKAVAKNRSRAPGSIYEILGITPAARQASQAPTGGEPGAAAPAGDLDGTAADSVTGDDIAGQIDSLFGEEQADAAADDLGAVADGVTGDDIAGQIDSMFGEEQDLAAGGVTGDDIAGQIDSIFGEADAVTAADLDGTATGSVTGDDIAGQIDSLFGGEETMSIPTGDILGDGADPAPDQISGDDISGQIDALFGEHTGDADTLTMPAVADSGQPSGDDVADQIDSLFGGESTAAEDIALQAAEQAEPAWDNAADQLFGGETMSFPAENIAAAEELAILPADQAQPTGDDVVDQLDQLFGGAGARAAAPVGNIAPSKRTSAAEDIAVQAVDQGEPTGDDVVDQIDQLFGGRGPAQEIDIGTPAAAPGVTAAAAAVDAIVNAPLDISVDEIFDIPADTAVDAATAIDIPDESELALDIDGAALDFPDSPDFANIQEGMDFSETPAAAEIPIDITETPVAAEIPIDITETPVAAEIPIDVTETPADIAAEPVTFNEMTANDIENQLDTLFGASAQGVTDSGDDALALGGGDDILAQADDDLIAEEIAAVEAAPQPVAAGGLSEEELAALSAELDAEFDGSKDILARA